jgi:hypothetical protein
VAILAAGALALAGPAAGAAAKVRTATFGSTLSKPPTNADPPATCDTSAVTARDTGSCTRVALGFAATGAVGNQVRVPFDGIIRRVRIRAGTPGTLRVTLVRLRNVDRAGGLGEGREVSRGRTVRVQTVGEGPPRAIDSFAVGLRAHAGDYLAVESSSISALRCEGGDTEQLLFQPPLQPFGDWSRSQDFDDCTLLVQATVTSGRKAKRR